MDKGIDELASEFEIRFRELKQVLKSIIQKHRSVLRRTSLFGGVARVPVSKDVITVAGKDLRKSSRGALAKIGVVFQKSTLDLNLSVERNLRYFAALQGLSGREADRRIDEALERLGMAERRRERVRDLNGGHRRRTEIARSLIHAPSVLLLDEPTVGLDAATRTAITDHVHDLCADQGLTVLWATHLTDEVRATDQLIILHRGQILRNDLTSDITGDRSLTDVFLDLTGVEA